MGVILKFIVFLLGLLFLVSVIWGVRAVGRLFRILLWPNSSTRRNSHREEQSQRSEPETQEDRIISYQKKNFESSLAEDVDFEEIKEMENQ